MPSDSMTTLEQIADSLAPYATSFELHCGKHPDHEAAMTCAACGVGMCNACVKGTADKTMVICQSCSAKALKTRALTSGIKLLKLPAAWVILCVVISGIAYSCNWSNPSLAVKSARESKRPWFQKHVGKLLLDKASRENQRAAALRFLKRPDEAVIWSKRAAISFAKTAEYWHETPVYNTLKIGEAKSIMESGDGELGLRMLKAINVKQHDVIYPGYIYYLGKAYADTGNEEQAQQCFKQSMASAEIIARKQLDHYVDLMSGDRRAAKVINSVRKICGVSLSVADLGEKLKEYNIKPKPEKESLSKSLEKFFPKRRLRRYPKPVKRKSSQVKSSESSEEIEIEFVKPVVEKEKSPSRQQKPAEDDFTIEFVK